MVRGNNNNATHACKYKEVMHCLFEYVAFVYASHDLHASKRLDNTCSLWYGGIIGAAEIVIREDA
jgi:hypothetical protein